MAFVTMIAAASVASADPYIDELDRLAAQSDLNELIMRVNQPRSADEFEAGLGWLRQRSLSGFGGARIHYSYAYGLFRAGVNETAAFAYLLGLLSGRLDAARCADPTAPGDKLQRWDQNMAPIFQHFLSLEVPQRRQLVALVVATEEGLGGRAPDAWLCSGGLSFMHRFTEKHKNNPSPPAREVQDPTRPGRTIILDDPQIKPEFVGDQEWRIRRGPILARFAEQLPAAK